MPQNGEGIYVGEGPDAPDAPEPKTPQSNEPTRVKVRVSLFFDGTGNNRVNTRERLANSEIYKKYGEDDNSYSNDESNVSRLQDCVTEGSSGYDHHVVLYVEGIGTRDQDSDVFWAKVLGKSGGAGVKDKVDKGVRMAIAGVMKVLPQDADVHVDLLTLDTFGFSRGAAAARYCVHRASNDEDGGWFGSDWHGLPSALERRGIPVAKFDVHAVGLFDTVSSYGRDHTDDVPELKLDAISVAKAVLQLAAANEYRTNFALTDIASAGGKGQEVFLPGAHSDIGGGYVDNDRESKDLKEGEATPDIANFLVHGGWFTAREANYMAYGRVEIEGRTRKVGRRVWLQRSGISNRYTYIPLHLMADFASKQGLNVALKKEFKPPPDLTALHRELQASVDSGAASHIGDWATHDDAARVLRRRYLHISFSGEIGMGVRVIPNRGGRFVPEREIFHG